MCSVEICSVGDCPVCAYMGEMVLLWSLESLKVFFFCPMCGVAWKEYPGKYIDEILGLEDLAPGGFRYASLAEVQQEVGVPWIKLEGSRKNLVLRCMSDFLPNQ